MTYMRFPPDKLATERQRTLLRQLTSPDNPQADDPLLSANDAWRLCGLHIECEERDARIIQFFGEDPAAFNQTTGEDRAAWLLSDHDRAKRWSDHPVLDDETAEVVHLALDAVEEWGIRHDVFFLPHMQDFDVHRTLQFEAEAFAWTQLSTHNVKHRGILRKLVREAMTERLRDIARQRPSQRE